MYIMYEQYLSSFQKYKAEYGQKVAIFLMVGIFYELYDARDPETGETKTTFNELVDLLGLKVSVKKGEGPGGSDGLVAGIPDYSVHKWAGRLTSAGWTVVLMEQKKNAAGKVTSREMQRILTPGSHIEAATGESMYLTFLSLSFSQGAPILALASIDLTTGHLHTFETTAQGTEDAWTSNDTIQFLELYPPKEVMWSIDGPRYFCESISEQKLKGLLGCQASTTFHKRTPLNSGAWLKPQWREEYIRQRCGLKSLLPTSVALHLQPGSNSETALMSLLYALEELWPSMNLGTLLVYPWSPGQTLRLGENALVQLHMIVQDDAKQDVLGLFDKCATPMGRRGLRERLLKPSADSETIGKNLDAVEAWTKKTMEYRLAVVQRMRTMTDVDRIYRKIQQGTVIATDIMGLDNTLKALEWLAAAECRDHLSDIAYINSEVFNVFDRTKVYEASDDTSLFLSGVVPALDELEDQIRTQMQRIQDWIKDIAKLGSFSPDTFKMEFREKSLVIKAPRAAVQALKIGGKLRATITAVVNKTGSYLECAELDQIFAILCRLRHSLSRQQATALVEKGTDLSVAIFEQWIRVADWITAADVNLTLARIALDNGYVRPTIVASSSTGHLAIEGLRHPLLEVQDRKIPYVQHSVTLGHEGSQGWLLYGLNASGKSSLMRATGLAVLLAQGGSFVPATKMTLAPFKSLHTRIINTDNLWMGLSSFAVEMAEMRDIFRVAGPQSLVLGDELCSGTETTSATALVAAGLKGLLNRGARFLFATHLHDLVKIPEVIRDPALKIWHLHVEYDQLRDKLIYHRILKEGSGSALYGLEVAKAMRIPADIMEDAIRFRKSLTGEAELLLSVGSSWNSAVIRRRCQKCGESEAENLEVHHIRERRTANAAGRLEDGSSVHAVANLAVLCDNCHLECHQGLTEARPHIQTSDGPEESVGSPVHSPPVGSPTVSINAAKSKWSEEELMTIRTVCEKYPKLSNKGLSNYLLNSHQIEICVASLKKFRN
jgi:DNA mismatch repair protein MutS